MSFVKTLKQIKAFKLFGEDQLHTMLFGGSRSGKTMAIVRAIMIRAAKEKSRHVSLRLNFNSAKTSLWMDTIPKCKQLCFPDMPLTKNKSDYVINFPNGSEYWIAGLDDDKRVEKILGKEFCVDPNSLILKSDLRWVKAREIKIGDELISFPENIDGHIKLIPSIVTQCPQIQAQRYKIITDKGETIVSRNHKFVTYFDDRRHTNFRSNSWRKASDLAVGDKIKFLGAPWEEVDNWASGWIAGIYDGEGWLSVDKVFQRSSLGVAQNEGPTLSKMKKALGDFGITYRVHKQGNKCYSLITKSIYSSMRILGISRPTRFIDKSRYIWNERQAFAVNPKSFYATIEKIIPLGRGNVIALETSTHTFISDGFLSHNSTIHFNECSQLSYSGVQMALTRLAEKNNLKKKAFYDQNPPEKSHWSYYLFEKKLNPIDDVPLSRPENYASMIMNPIDNLDNIDQEYIGLLESLPERERDRFLLGKYTDNTGGQVYYSFNSDIHVKKVERRPGTLYVAMDFNVNPMTAVIGQVINNIFCIVDEAFLENSDTFRMANYLIKKNYIGDLIPDSTGRNRKTSGQSDFEILKQKGFNILKVHNPLQWDRTNNVNRLFQDNRIIIDPKCKKLINDLHKTTWKDEKIYSGTDKMLGHISDALGYFAWKIEPFGSVNKSRTIQL